MEWKCPSSPVAQEESWCWPCSGILKTYMEHGTAVTCCDMLHRRLKPAIHSRTGRLSEGVLLLHDDSCPILRPASWKGKSWNIQLTVQVWCHLIFTVWTA
jgi:hypothetical protein